MTSPKLYMLIGVPGSGKSTWAVSQDWFPSCEYVSTDQYVEAYARSVNKTYSEVFDFFMSNAVKLMTDAVTKARRLRKDIIWDQTSTTVLSRKKKFNMLPEYHSIAIVFPTPPADELNRRLKTRPGKTIPMNIVDQMISNFEMPTVEEGFAEIWHV